MINKNIKKILNKKEIKSINGLKLNSRPSEIKPEIIIKLLNYLRRNKYFLLMV